MKKVLLVAALLLPAVQSVWAGIEIYDLTAVVNVKNNSDEDIQFFCITAAQRGPTVTVRAHDSYPYNGGQVNNGSVCTSLNEGYRCAL